MKFFITFMLVLLMMVITGLAMFVLHTDQEEKISDIIKKVADLEKEVDDETEIIALRKKIIETNEKISPLERKLQEVEMDLKLNIEPIVAANKQDRKTMIQELDLYCQAVMEDGEHPVNIDKYGKENICSELFTADDCGLERLSRIIGVDETGTYIRGLYLSLKNKPSYGLRTNMQNIGFSASLNCTSLNNTSCLDWVLDEELTQQDLKKLKTYYREFDNCRSIY
ncbi:hypothetical protein GF382_02970 [Candidatus Falkowbacteria bacterium]|nr:hypothetical protein [Candidatus Falkowbacteria bacterium]